MMHYVENVTETGLAAKGIIPVENDSFIIQDEDKEQAFVFRNGKMTEIRPEGKRKVLGLNAEHNLFRYFYEDPGVVIINLFGAAGSGKTFLSLGCALESLSRNEIDKILIIRELVPATKFPMGTLPGSADEKMWPMFRAIEDTVESLAKRSTKLFKGDPMTEMDGYIRAQRIEFSTLETLRGRNLENHVIIADDGQNIDREGLKLIITRMSAGSKLILNGDISQIDNYRIRGDNGMSYLSKITEHGTKEVAELKFTHSECRSGIIKRYLEWEEAYEQRMATR